MLEIKSRGEGWPGGGGGGLRLLGLLLYSVRRPHSIVLGLDFDFLLTLFVFVFCAVFCFCF